MVGRDGANKQQLVVADVGCTPSKTSWYAVRKFVTMASKAEGFHNGCHREIVRDSVQLYRHDQRAYR